MTIPSYLTAAQAIRACKLSLHPFETARAISAKEFRPTEAQNVEQREPEPEHSND